MMISKFNFWLSIYDFGPNKPFVKTEFEMVRAAFCVLDET